MAEQKQARGTAHSGHSKGKGEAKKKPYTTRYREQMLAIDNEHDPKVREGPHSGGVGLRER